MSTPDDHPALTRLSELSTRAVSSRPASSGPRQPARMGYQPSLDGVRAVSVIAVLLYHAGFQRFHGGFFGVEVFFVVSGYLITSLLIEEHDVAGRVNLRQFWLRRFRRLLPAALTMILAVAVWVALFGNPINQSDVRRDSLSSIFYVANWGQIFGDVPYDANLSPFRHLWSLAVEEQFYLVWPLVFFALTARRVAAKSIAVGLAVIVAVVMIVVAVTSRGGDLTTVNSNFLYLSSVTRAAGLLAGCAAAFVWRPWRASRPAAPTAGWILDGAALAAVAVLAWSILNANLKDPDAGVFRWNMHLVTLASLTIVLVAVHPASMLVRRGFGWRPLVEIGKRSYGLYLWSWPISVGLHAYSGSFGRFVAAMVLTAAVSEACYRFVETPIRKGAIGRWWAARPVDRGTIVAAASVSAIALTVPAAMFYSQTEETSIAQDTSDVTVDLGAVLAASGESSVPTSGDGDGDGDGDGGQSPISTPDTGNSLPVTPSTPPVTPAVLPRRVVIVGDSQAHSLAINLPDGVESTFSVADGSVEGCGVYDQGRARSSRDGYTRGFADCSGWQSDWADAASSSDAELALVVLGAWDVFDIEIDGRTIAFGTAEADQLFLSSLDSGVEALKSAGTHVALLEVACMRPQDVDGAGTPALPERGDDVRIARLNDLLRQAAAADPTSITFVEGPDEWCGNEEISANLGYRWDGVHVYKPGAALIIESIAADLLAIPLPA